MRPVIHVGSERKKKEIFQLVSTSILPPLSKQMPLEPKPREYCPVCGLKGRFPWPLHYDSSALTDIKDINYMAEYLDYGICLQRYLVISARARDLFLKLNKTKKAKFEPIILIND